MTSSTSFQPRVVLGASLIVLPSSCHWLILPLGLVDQGLLDGPEAVQVLDLDDRRGDRLAVLGDVQIDVGVAAQRAFLHLAVGDLEVAEGEPSSSRQPRVGGAADVGLGDDLQERDAGAVQVHLREPAVAVHQLAGVFFEVNAGQAALAASAAVLADRDLEIAAASRTAGRTG